MLFVVRSKIASRSTESEGRERGAGRGHKERVRPAWLSEATEQRSGGSLPQEVLKRLQGAGQQKLSIHPSIVPSNQPTDPPLTPVHRFLYNIKLPSRHKNYIMLATIRLLLKVPLKDMDSRQNVPRTSVPRIAAESAGPRTGFRGFQRRGHRIGGAIGFETPLRAR